MKSQGPMPFQYPQTMLRVMMRKSAEARAPEVRHGFAAEAKAIQQRDGSRQAVGYLLGQLGLEVSADRDEAYCAEALNFHLGLLEGYAGRPDAMAEHIRLSRTMPGPEDDRLFSDHVAICAVTGAQQRDAIGRAVPAVLFGCMPRSASATLTHSLARLLDVPILHVSIGAFPDYFIAPSWLDMVLEGGAVTQDHFMLNDFNFGVLKARGPRHLFVTVRDPRAAARSQVHWLARWGYAGSASLEQRIEQQCVGNFIPWLQGWIERSRDPTSPLHIHMIKFADIVHDLAGTVRNIAHVLKDEYPAMAALAARADVEEVRVHFNQGDDDAWRSEVRAATRQKLWDACTPDIKELLALAP
jgi:hypothetical protein